MADEKKSDTCPDCGEEHSTSPKFARMQKAMDSILDVLYGQTPDVREGIEVLVNVFLSIVTEELEVPKEKAIDEAVRIIQSARQMTAESPPAEGIH